MAVTSVITGASIDTEGDQPYLKLRFTVIRDGKGVMTDTANCTFAVGATQTVIRDAMKAAVIAKVAAAGYTLPASRILSLSSPVWL